MAEFKIVISTKDGKSIQKEIKDDTAKSLIGKKIGDAIKGELFDLTGYEFQITGGSDYCGFPMRKDVSGPQRKKILDVQGVGVKRKKKLWRKGKRKQRYAGARQRVIVAGNTIYEKTSQVNLKVTKEGKAPLAPKEEQKEEPSKE